MYSLFCQPNPRFCSHCQWISIDPTLWIHESQGRALDERTGCDRLGVSGTRITSLESLALRDCVRVRGLLPRKVETDLDKGLGIEVRSVGALQRTYWPGAIVDLIQV